MVRLVVGYYLSRLLRRPLVWGRPFSISVEPVSVCNLKCPECPTGAGIINRPAGMLTRTVFMELLTELPSSLFYMNFFLQGEPLMHRELPAMIKLASSRHLYTVVSTNAQLLNANMAVALVESGLSRIIVSLDGLTPESYSHYRVGGQLQKVLDGISNLNDAKTIKKANTPFVVVQFLVFRHNEHELPLLKNIKSLPGVDKIEIKSAQLFERKEAGMEIPSNSRYSRYQWRQGRLEMKGKMMNHCQRIFKSMVVTWDGRVAPCCYDKDLDHQVGELSSESFSNIWKGWKFNAFRKQVLKRKSTIDICRNCPEGRRWWD
jgi:radical SAM protein with 4Fe4S-binding SPASM domain